MKNYSYISKKDIELDKYLFHLGENFKSYNFLGAHPYKEGYHFLVWAPHAKEVHLVGDFNEWNGSPMKRITTNGLWSLAVSPLSEYSNYKYKILTFDDREILKADPFGFYSEKRPKTASKTLNLDTYEWNDQKWLKKRHDHTPFDRPINIYEMNIMSWKKDDEGNPLTYRQLAEILIPYLKKYNYTHVEFMPLYEHPFDGSWGYQMTGYFAITSRYGSPRDFMYLVDQLHQHEIGIILDWVPCHFCKDAHGLRQFDGSPLFESPDITIANNDEWDTLNFDYGRSEVMSFLISSAMFLFDKFHIDGIRVDAVAHMLYRSDGSHNNDAVKLIQTLNKAIFKEHPHALMIAEESTAWPLVTGPVHKKGLGFNFKWNMGWMNDILDFFELDPIYRQYHSNLITFSITYAFSENFILPLSHDEVVHGKKSLLNKMPGDYWQKFANLRLLFAYLMTHPGKKLTFMGAEFGQFIEWNEWQELDWFLPNKYEKHGKMWLFTQELNQFYLNNSELYELDTSYDGFKWINHETSDHFVIAFMRKNRKGESLIIVCNFTPETLINYRIGVDKSGIYKEMFNTDLEKYGGANKVNTHHIQSQDEEIHGYKQSIQITVPPLGTTILKKQTHANKNKGGK